MGADLSVIVNTGDDLERHGLAIWPDPALSAEQVAQLTQAGGYPLRMVPRPLVYLPLVREVGDAIGSVTSTTITGTTVDSDHPRVLR